MAFLETLIRTLNLVFSVVLIIAVMLRTTKSEGLTGVIGGQSSSSLQTKVGIERELDRITRWAAIGFLGTAFLSLFFWK